MKWYGAVVLGFLLSTGAVSAEETAKPAELQSAEAGITARPAQAEDAAGGSILKTEEQKVSYAMGLSLGKYFKSLEENFDFDLVQRGIQDGFSDGKALLTEEEMQQVQQDFSTRQHSKQIKKREAMLRKNHLAADEFLAANKKKKGVEVTASGLQYKVIKAGKGAKPTAQDTVRVHYKGSTLDGNEFDSSYKRNEPTEFQVGQVIRGWQEAMQLMPAGSTYELYLPPDLAYGDEGALPMIEPGSLLIFEVELLDVIKADKGAEALPAEKK